MIESGAPPNAGGLQVLTLGVGDDLFAVPVTRVQEILDLQRVSRLPNAPRHLLGVIDVRGEGVPVVDMRELLSMAPLTDTETTRIVVLWVTAGDDRAVVALKADRVFEVTALDFAALMPLPKNRLLRWEQQMVVGLGRVNGKFVTVLDLDRMFDAEDLQVANSGGGERIDEVA